MDRLNISNSFDENKSTKILLLIFSFLLPLLYFDELHNPSALPRMAMLSMASVVLIVVWIIKNNNKELTLNYTTLFLALFVAWATLSLAWGVHKSNGYIEIVQLWALFLLFVFVRCFKGRSSLIVLTSVCVVSASIAAYIGLLQNWGVDLFGFRYVFSMGSTFYFKTHATLYFDLIFPVSFFLLIVLESKYLKFIFSILSGVILGYLLESHARGAWLSLASVFVLTIIVFITLPDAKRLIKKVKLRSVGYLLIVPMLGGGILLMPGEVEKRWQEKTKESVIFEKSTSVRIVNYSNSIELIKESPITGVGYGDFWKAFRPYMNKPELNPNSYVNNYMYRLHNDLLQIFVELGVVGVSLFLSFFVYLVIVSIKSIRSDISDTEKILLVSISLALCASGVHSLVDFPLHKPSSAAQIFIWAGILAAYDKSNVFSIKLSVNRNIFLLLAVIYAGSIGVYYYKFLKSNNHFYHADRSIESNDCSSAIDHIDNSVGYFTHYLPNHFTRVSIYAKCEKNTEALFNVMNDEIEWDDTQLLALHKRGDIYRELGLLDKSLNDYRRILEILPHRPGAKYKIALVYLQMNDIDTAKTVLYELTQEHQNYLPAIELLDELNRK